MVTSCFDNTPQGVASYIQSVIDLKRDEFAQAGVNKLFEDYPIVGDFLNYYVAMVIHLKALANFEIEAVLK